MTMDMRKELCWSPTSDDQSDINIAYQTPITSPETSPIKLGKQRLIEVVVTQYDGEYGSAGHSEEVDSHAGHDMDIDSDAGQRQESDSHADYHTTLNSDAEQSTTLNGDHMEVDSDVDKPTILDVHQMEIDMIPRQMLVKKAHSLSNIGSPAHKRRAAYLRGVNFPDRYIPGRLQAPSKERLLTSKTTEKYRHDPFRPSCGRSSKTDQQFTVTRFPALAIQSYDSATNVQRNHRVASASSTWTVGSFPVTEGIASTSNGRGGRITSGTNAPLYNADMLLKTQVLDDSNLHGQRLAIALDLDIGGNIFKAQPAPPTNSICTQGKTVWKYGHWYNDTPVKGIKLTKQKIPELPYKVLDAPELRNDYYCTLLAYSSTLHCIAVGLNNHVYLWRDKKLKYDISITESLVFPDHHKHVTSLCFSSGAGGNSILAIGCADGRLTLWNPRERAARLSCNQPLPISHVSFRPCTSRRPSARDPQVIVDTEELLVGTDNGNVLLYSVEWPDMDQCDLFDWSRSMILRTIVSCNQQQICGIAWSVDGEMFATGGNDNQLFVFDFDKVELKDDRATSDTAGHIRLARALSPGSGNDHPVILAGGQKQVFTLNAAVKAIAFAPWQSTLLAASGGSNDRCIHFLHTTSGSRLATINCHAQVTSLIWNTKRKEIAATLGFAQPDHPYRVVVFGWPSCEQLVSIPWPNEERALFGISYPGNLQGKKTDCIVIATSDHNIKFHEVWSDSKKGSNHAGVQAKSQILNDICSNELEDELQIR